MIQKNQLGVGVTLSGEPAPRSGVGVLKEGLRPSTHGKPGKDTRFTGKLTSSTSPLGRPPSPLADDTNVRSYETDRDFMRGKPVDS